MSGTFLCLTYFITHSFPTHNSISNFFQKAQQDLYEKDAKIEQLKAEIERFRLELATRLEADQKEAEKDLGTQSEIVYWKSECDILEKRIKVTNQRMFYSKVIKNHHKVIIKFQELTSAVTPAEESLDETSQTEQNKVKIFFMFFLKMSLVSEFSYIMKGRS